MRRLEAFSDDALTLAEQALNERIRHGQSRFQESDGINWLMQLLDVLAEKNRRTCMDAGKPDTTEGIFDEADRDQAFRLGQKERERR